MLREHLGKHLWHFDHKTHWCFKTDIFSHQMHAKQPFKKDDYLKNAKWNSEIPGICKNLIVLCAFSTYCIFTLWPFYAISEVKSFLSQIMHSADLAMNSIKVWGQSPIVTIQDTQEEESPFFSASHNSHVQTFFFVLTLFMHINSYKAWEIV